MTKKVKSPVSESQDAVPSKVPQLIEHFCTRIRAIRRCADEHISFAVETHAAWLDKFLEEKTEGDGRIARADLRSSDLVEFIERATAPHSDILSQGLLIFGFSTFDAFVGMFLRQIHRENAELVHKLEEKSLTINELLKYGTVPDAIEALVDRDVSNLLRKSYDKQFSILASRYGLATLKKFSSWPVFIEAAQRRNLITHCDGVVNAEYIRLCKEAGCKLSSSVEVGKTLHVDDKYLRDSLDILYEVGLKLGHTVWRAASPESIAISESSLTDALFALLSREEWGLAMKIGEFAINIPGKKNELQSRISRINYAQALKWSGDNVSALGVLDEVDWSGSIRDLRLGVAVIREEFDEAAKLMREIGRKGELVLQRGYESWPVFRDFRKSDQFKIAFKEIYGTEFAENGQKASVATESTVDGDGSQKNGSTRLPIADTIGLAEEPPGEPQMPSEQPEDDMDQPQTDQAGND